MKIERALLEACIENKRAAQNELYKELFSYLMSICMRYKKDYNTAGASLNAIYLKILTHLPNFEQHNSFISWVKRIAVNHLIDEYRKEKREKERLSYAEESKVNPFVEQTYHRGAAELESEYLLKMIQKLPQRESEVFNLYAIDGYKHREIAELLNIKENTSKWLLREARLKLQAMLEKFHETIEHGTE